MLVCYGEGCNVCFTNVHFADCPVIVLAGAQVTFEGCTFKACEADALLSVRKRPQVAVFAHGKGTSVSISASSMEGDTRAFNGLLVREGAAAHVDQTSLAGFIVSAIDVKGAESRLICESCVVQGMPHNSISAKKENPMMRGILPDNVIDKLNLTNDPAPSDKGIVATDGAHITVKSSHMNDTGSAIVMWFSTAHIENTSISLCYLSGVFANGCTAVHLSGCLIEKCLHSMYGYGVMGMMCDKLSLDRCVLLDLKHIGAHVSENGNLAITECTCIRCGVSAYSAVGEGTVLSVTKSTVKEARIGVRAEIGAECYCNEVFTVDCEVGFDILKVSKHVELIKCDAKDFSKRGVFILGKGACVHIQEGRFVDTLNRKGPNGIEIANRARAHVSSSVLHCHGAGIEAQGKGSVATVERCKIHAHVGAVAMHGAELIMSDSYTWHCGGGVKVANGGVARLSNWISNNDLQSLKCFQSYVEMNACQLLAFYMGVEFEGKGEQASCMRNCTLAAQDTVAIQGEHSECLVVRGKGSAVTARKCVFTGSELSCVRVKDNPDATVILRDCDISNSYSYGVELAEERCKVHLKGCTMKGHDKYGVICSKGQVVVEHTHSTRNTQGAFCLKGSGQMQLTRCSSDLDGSGVYASRDSSKASKKDGASSVPCLTMSQVLFRRCERYGVGLFNGVRCYMQSCCVMQCGKQGMEVKGAPASTSISVIDCVFQKNNDAGVRAYDGGVVSVKNCVARDNKGSGFLAKQSGTQMQLTQCESSKNSSPYHSTGDAVMDVLCT